MSVRLFVQQSLITHPVWKPTRPEGGSAIEVVDRFEQGGFALIETAFLPQLTGYRIDSECGISLRDCGLVRFYSTVRPDELEAPTIRLQTESMTTELLARATIPGYFGFTPSSWITDSQTGYDALVLDEVAGVSATESAYSEDVTRGWFVLTGVPFVSHIVAVPDAASPDEREAVTSFIHSCYEGDLSDTVRFAVDQGAETGLIEAVMDDVASVMTGDERLGIPELFRRCGIETGYREVPWLI